MKRARDPLPDGYMRPQQAWQCGLADEGPPCPLGPDGHGVCPAAAACRPVRDGDRWHCIRSSLRGGPCAGGPGPDGECSVVYRCSPVQSLRARRGRIVAAATLAALGTAIMALSGPLRNEIIAPGPLSRSHARLLEGQAASQRCAQCHAAGEASMAGWVSATIGGTALGETQSALCLECHTKLIPKELALVAHNAPSLRAGASSPPADPSQRAGGEDAPARRRDPAAPIACAACHREHQGLSANIAAMSDAACQACHQHQYHRFAVDHPEFDRWPYEQRTRIAFNHATHQLKHFPAEKQSFACAACHQADAGGERQLTAAFETACASCHDKSIAASLASGLPLVTIPTLDLDALDEAGRDLRPWPAEASGDFEGAPPAFAKLLLAADPQGAAALAKLGPRFDFFDVDPDDAEQLAAAADLATALRALVNELGEGGQPAVGARLKTLLGRDVSDVELQALIGSLPTDLVAGYRDRWFGAAAADQSAPKPAADAPWRRDDAALALRYQPGGHADPWLRAWLDLLAEAASSPRPEVQAVADPLLRDALKPTAPGQCGSCHTLDRNDAGTLAIQWRALAADNAPRGFTRFDHAPHLTQPQLADCASCHRVAAEAAAAPSTVANPGDDPKPAIADFAPLSRDACATCHTPRAAGDSCVQCHRYHVGEGRR